MRWSRLLPFVVVLVLAGSFAGTATAVDVGGRPSVQWAGKTDKGLLVNFTISRKNGGPVISEMEFDLHLKCEVSGNQTDAFVGFGGFDVPIRDNAFSFEYNDGSFYVKWTGVFDSPIHVSGSLAGVIPGLTQDVQAELCPSGKHAWQGHPVPSGASEAAGAGSAAVRITFTRDASGRVHSTTEG